MKKTDKKLLKIISTAFIVLAFLILTVFLNLKDNINVNLQTIVDELEALDELLDNYISRSGL